MNRLMSGVNAARARAATIVRASVLAATFTATVAIDAQDGTGATRPAPDAAAIAQINAGRNAPDYPFPYEPASVEQISAVLERVRAYLVAESPVRVLDGPNGKPVTDLRRLPDGFVIERGTFAIIGYEQGVTYAGMLAAAAATGDKRYAEFVDERLGAVALFAAWFREHPDALKALLEGTTPGAGRPPNRRLSMMRSFMAPRSLDDAGAMCAAMLKAHAGGLGGDVRPIIDTYMQHIREAQFRLEDRTLARNRPLPRALWLDDLYMSVPALAQMGALTGDAGCFDDAARQMLQFSERMFLRERGLYLHGWIESMADHPAFHWGRANGWAAMAAVELLSALPEHHAARPRLLEFHRAHMRGLAACQGNDGLWHQLLDRDSTYPETSASAMFVFALARGINRGWLDPLAFGPAASLGWNAVAAQVNAAGQVEGTCVGTGMGFDPMFYARRPVSVFAAHGYGPVLLAGAEMIELRKGKGAAAAVSDGAVQFGKAESRF